jgi:catechol 2,3-dioxygenase-like lactoylglutathione lyase family enzyme
VVSAVGSAAPKVDRVIETCLHVDDLGRAGDFYERVLGLKAMTGDARFRAYDVGGKSVLLLFRRGATRETVRLPGGTIPPHGGEGQLHVAFAVSAEELADWDARLAQHGVAIEGRMEWPAGGRSLYFRDPDRHLIELATPGLWAIY